jgi:hypothetical protein
MLKFDSLGSWGKILLFFYLIIAGNFIGDTFLCKIQDLLAGSIAARHIIAITTLYFFVLIVDDRFKNYHPLKMILVSMLVYLYFLISTKSKRQYFIAAISLLVIIALFENIKIYLQNKKTELSNNERRFMDNIKKIQIGVFGLMVLITFIGFFIYLGEKKVEYPNFSSIKFLFGTKFCKGNKMDFKSSEFKYFLKGIGLK